METDHTNEEVLEMQRIVAANRDRIIEALLASKKKAVLDCDSILADNDAILKGLGYKKTRQPRAASGTVGAEPAKKRTRKKAA